MPGAGRPGAADRPRGAAADGTTGSGGASALAVGSAAAGGQNPAGSSVFAPGYDARRSEGDRPAAARPGSPAASTWYGSTADGAAGKGPVHGYPPAPGQPAPMYPPGEFSAWNRGHDGRTRPQLPPDQADRGQAERRQADRGHQDRLQPGGGHEAGWLATGQPETGQPDRGPSQAAAWQSASGAAAGISRYYQREDDPDAEPGYSMLAVSDPAADVTSTQTWQAVGDGRATGIWTAPARPGAAPVRPAVPPARQRQNQTDAAEPPAAADADERADRDLAAAAGPGVSAGLDAAASTDEPADPASPAGATLAGLRRPGSRAAGTRSGSARSRGRGHSGAHTGPSGGQRTDGVSRSEAPASRRGERSAQPPRIQPARSQPQRIQSPLTPAPLAPSPRPDGGASRGGRQARGGRPASVRLAISVALLLVLAAAATLAYSVLHSAPKPKPAAASRPTTAPSASASASPSIGPYGLIGSRKSDPKPLTVAQLFPRSFAVSGGAVTQAATKLGKNCASAVDGANIKSAVSSAGCDQVVRATYVLTAQGLMGTIGVLNLSTAADATKAARSADARDFISQLKAKHGPARTIGAGTGIEEAAAKGHYLILIWAEFTSRHKPKTTAQRTQIETFMTELLQNTANVSLTDRMLTGTP